MCFFKYILHTSFNKCFLVARCARTLPFLTLARYISIIRVVVKLKVFLAMCVDIGDTGPPDLPLIGLSATSVTMSMIPDILVHLTISGYFWIRYVPHRLSLNPFLRFSKAIPNQN